MPAVKVFIGLVKSLASEELHLIFRKKDWSSCAAALLIELTPVHPSYFIQLEDDQSWVFAVSWNSILLMHGLLVIYGDG